MTNNTDVSIPVLHCNQCGHDWIPRVPTPKKCPACCSYRYNKPKHSTDLIHIMVSEEKEHDIDIKSLVANKLKEE